MKDPLHGRLDVVLKEDAAEIRNGNAMRNKNAL